MEYKNDWNSLIASFGYGTIKDIEQYKIIVKIRAYTDMQPRTIKGLGEFRKSKKNNDELNSLFDEIADKLYLFIIKEDAKSKDKFDKWHSDICNDFTNGFNEKTKGHDVDKILFGKAQKIINVSFKYIYCLKGAEKYIDKFKYCHMILDRYTYSEGFYRKEVVEWFNKSHKNKKILKKDIKSWSNLKYRDYKDIQEKICEYLKSKESKYSGLTPFQAEFYIFNEYKKDGISD